MTAAARVTVIGAATSAGTHHAGQERAPDALRADGFIERLVRAGLTVTDVGNVARETFRVDGGGPVRNVAATVRAARAVADAGGAGGRGRWRRGRSRTLIVHFDVDAVDSGDLPLANFPHYGTGVPLAVAGEVLSVLFAAPTLSAVVLTEVNPGYDSSGDSLRRYIDTVTAALAAGLTGSD